MSKEIQKSNPEPDHSGDGIWATAAEAVKDLITSAAIPAQILKNAYKAFDRLSTALIDIPVASLEGIAAEKRAHTQARVKLISVAGDKIAEQMNADPEYARVAMNKYGQKILREQIILDSISGVAAQQIQADVASNKKLQTPSTETAPIDDDWLSNFESVARNISTEKMQLLFGRILAGEIQRPSTFSIKTVNLLGELDRQAAVLSQRLCSLCVSLRVVDLLIDARVVSLGGNAAANSLQDYGLNFDQLNHLQEYGLIISDYHSYFDYRMCIADENRRVGLAFAHQNKQWGLAPSPERPKDGPFLLHGVALSRSGKELLGIVDIEPDDKYTVALQAYFQTQQLQMVEIAKK